MRHDFDTLILLAFAVLCVIVVLTLGGCAASSPTQTSQDVTLIIRVVPTRQLIDSGHRSGPMRDDTRPYTYRIRVGARTICGIVAGDDILDGSPHALARFAWEEANCAGHGGDFP